MMMHGCVKMCERATETSSRSHIHIACILHIYNVEPYLPIWLNELPQLGKLGKYGMNMNIYLSLRLQTIIVCARFCAQFVCGVCVIVCPTPKRNARCATCMWLDSIPIKLRLYLRVCCVCVWATVPNVAGCSAINIASTHFVSSMHKCSRGCGRYNNYTYATVGQRFVIVLLCAYAQRLWRNVDPHLARLSSTTSEPCPGMHGGIIENQQQQQRATTMPAIIIIIVVVRHCRAHCIAHRMTYEYCGCRKIICVNNLNNHFEEMHVQSNANKSKNIRWKERKKNGTHSETGRERGWCEEDVWNAKAETK